MEADAPPSVWGISQCGGPRCRLSASSAAARCSTHSTSISPPTVAISPAAPQNSHLLFARSDAAPTSAQKRSARACDENSASNTNSPPARATRNRQYSGSSDASADRVRPRSGTTPHHTGSRAPSSPCAQQHERGCCLHPRCALERTLRTLGVASAEMASLIAARERAPKPGTLQGGPEHEPRPRPAPIGVMKN